MRLGVLFSGGKDSTYAAYLMRQQEHQLACLITIYSKNKESYMFHTPSITKVKYQAKLMKLPLLVQKSRGEKEKELKDLKKAIKKAIKKYEIEGIVTGALHSIYQAERIQKICDELKIKCINPLWHKEEIPYLEELIKNNFKIAIIGVFAYPLDEKWLGRLIDKKFIEDVKGLKEKYKIHPAGEGGEFETFVLNCPMFSRELKVKSFKDFKEGTNSFRRELKVR